VTTATSPTIFMFERLKMATETPIQVPAARVRAAFDSLQFNVSAPPGQGWGQRDFEGLASNLKN
jgi:hypothetical protein